MFVNGGHRQMFFYKRQKPEGGKMTDKKVFELNQNQENMLNFLRHTSEEHPMNLDNAFDLKNENNLTTIHRDYLEISNTGLVKSNKRGAWITKEGLEALKAHIQNLIKNNKK